MQGLEEDAGRWQRQASKLQAVIRQAFYKNDRWYDDLQRTTYSQLTATLAYLTDTIQPGEKESVLDDIAARSLDPNDDYLPENMVLASPFMHHYIFEALRRGGRFEQLLEIVRLRWGRWANEGCPTTWENWSVDFPDVSLCHSFSAHPRFHLAEIARRQ